MENPYINHNFKTGDGLLILGSGEAGVGHPEEQDPEAVNKDVKNELVSLKAARDINRVVMDPDTLEIDYKRTQELRAKS